ncbi:hypothetical protein [Micromonospora palomenae]|uniref:hypothetical protein n=1 Tax=Micromonospora palomenae TaxID=1461247 RepID=UPI003F8871B1
MTGRAWTRDGEAPEALRVVGTVLVFFVLELARPNHWLTGAGDAPVFVAQFLTARILVDLLWAGYARIRRGRRAGPVGRVTAGPGSTVVRWLAWAVAVLVWSFLAHRLGDLTGRAWVEEVAYALVIGISISSAPRPGRVVPSRPSLVLVGLPLLIGVMMLGARVVASSWAAAADSAVASPYTWLAVVAWLDYLLSQDRRAEDRRRRWPVLRAAGDLLLAVVQLAAVFGTWWPDRWYATLARIVLALCGAAWFARVVRLLLDPPSVPAEGAEPAGPARSPERDGAGVADGPASPEDRGDPLTPSAP